MEGATASFGRGFAQKAGYFLCLSPLGSLKVSTGIRKPEPEPFPTLPLPADIPDPPPPALLLLLEPSGQCGSGHADRDGQGSPTVWLFYRQRLSRRQ